MSTKIDLQLGVKTEILNAGSGEKSQSSKEESTDFRQILDEAFSARPVTVKKNCGKNLPKIGNESGDMSPASANVVQKSLVSNRMIITTESSAGLEEIETFAAKQGLASSSLIDLLEDEVISKSTLHEITHLDSSFNPLMSQGGADSLKQITKDDFKILIKHGKLDDHKVFDGDGTALSESDKQNFGQKLAPNNIEIQNLLSQPNSEKVRLMSSNEKVQPKPNSVVNTMNVGAPIEQPQEVSGVNKGILNQVILNKQVKVRGTDILIKSVALEKNNFFKEYDKASIKLEYIDLRQNFFGLLEKENKFKGANNSLKTGSSESLVGKLGHNYQSQYVALSEAIHNSPGESKGKIDEQPNNLSRLSQLQNMTAKFADSLVNRLTSQINKGAWRIEMEMHPRSLGKVSVQMEMVNGSLEAQFFTNQSLTKDLILESVPRLREMLENNGTNNAEVSVELKNDGNSDKERFFTESGEQKFNETDVKTDEDEPKRPVNNEIPGRYDFLV